MRALVVGVEDEGAAAGDRAGPAPSAARARLAVAAVIVGTALLAGVLGPGAGAERNSAESWPNVPARAWAGGSVETQGDSLVKTRKFGSDVVLGAAAAAAVSMSALAGDAVQWRVADGGNGHWYARSTDNAMWLSAKATAQAVGGHLATIQGAGENEFIRSLSTTVQWIGGLRAAGSCGSDCNWGWDTGETWGFTNWRLGEPNGGVIEQSLDFYADGTWNDDNGLSLPYIIEWDADCNSDGIVDYGQILNGALADANTNGVPDICECATHPELGACRCAGDIVTDGTVNGADLGTLLAYWGPANSGTFSRASDINSDGRIDGSDLGVLLSNWGTCQYPGVTVPAWATLIDAMPDPAVVTDPALRTAIAATGLAWRVRDTGTGIEMLLVPPGTFQMGCSASTQGSCNPMEFPVHPVTLPNAFYLGRFEVTQEQWQSKMGSNPSYFQGYPDSPIRPVDGVSWNMTQAFASATNMRLPTEAEWEYACRANTSTAFYNNSNDDSTVVDIAWCSANSGGQSHAVGQKKANRLGFHDMVGNVWEWTNDWYADYTNAAQSNPQGPASGPGKVLRGSTSFGEASSEFRSSYRGYEPPSYMDFARGFRVARNP